MEQDFYKGRIKEKFGIETIIPDNSQREFVHNVILKELCLGKILESSKQQYLEIIDCLANQGAEAIILGCTEIPLLIKQDDSKIPLIDSTRIHAKETTRLALVLG